MQAFIVNTIQSGDLSEFDRLEQSKDVTGLFRFCKVAIGLIMTGELQTQIINILYPRITRIYPALDLDAHMDNLTTEERDAIDLLFMQLCLLPFADNIPVQKADQITAFNMANDISHAGKSLFLHDVKFLLGFATYYGFGTAADPQTGLQLMKSCADYTIFDTSMIMQALPSSTPAKKTPVPLKILKLLLAVIGGTLIFIPACVVYGILFAISLFKYSFIPYRKAVYDGMFRLNRKMFDWALS